MGLPLMEALQLLKLNLSYPQESVDNFFWWLSVKCGDVQSSKMYLTAKCEFTNKMDLN